MIPRTWPAAVAVGAIAMAFAAAFLAEAAKSH